MYDGFCQDTFEKAGKISLPIDAAATQATRVAKTRNFIDAIFRSRLNSVANDE